MQIRHIESIPVNFSVTDREFNLTVDKIENQKISSSVLTSNDRLYVEHFNSLFEELWKKGISAVSKIREIEEGIDAEFYEVITDSKKASQILVDMAKSARNEALFVLPKDMAMRRVGRLGIINYLINASQSYGNADIRIICPLSELNSEIVERISRDAPSIKVLNGNNSSYGLFIVDGKKFLGAELKDPNAQEFSEAIGFATYSNSKLSVESFRSLYWLVWNERMLNEELKRAEKMQKEFINLAAHELRTPAQAILGYTELAMMEANDDGATNSEKGGYIASCI